VADVHGAQKVLSSNGFRMANCFCCLTKCHGVPCLLPSRITTKVLKTARLFLQDRDQEQDQMFETKTRTSWSKTKSLETKTWSLGLHHCSQRITYDMGTTIPTRRYNYPVIRINPHIIRIMTRILGARYSAGTRNYRLSALWVVCADFRQAQVGSKPG